MARHASTKAGLVAGLLRSALGAGGREPEIHRIRHIGEGLSHDAYFALVEGEHGPEGLVVLLARAANAARDRRIRAEARLADELAALSLPFFVPRSRALVETRTGLAWIRECALGMPLAKLRDPAYAPWTLTGTLAAAVHAVPLAAVPSLDGHATRRAHGQASLLELASLADDPEPLVAEALAWMDAHLPPEEPAALLHGDLLGQNILVDLVDGSPPALIDWEHARRGDPAYDLAIVTRGLSRPFGEPRGFELLLEAYRAASGRALPAREVRFHELWFALSSYRDPEVQGSREEKRALVRRVLGWARAGT
jgi:aminoglycoside phosphotransferase (APT) family kinase protein